MEYFRILRSGLPSACLLAIVCVMNSGCAKVYHAVHYNPVSLAMHDHVKNYYHSEKTGRVIPKDRCYIPEEPPCYGYEPTCWTRWPADCPKCPVDCECEQEVIIHDQVIGGAHESVIADESQSPEPAAPTQADPEVESSLDDASAPGEVSSPSDVVEPDYEEGATIAPVISADDLPNYQSNTLPVRKEAPDAVWLPGSTGGVIDVEEDVVEKVIRPLEQPRSIAKPTIEQEEQITQPDTQVPEPTEPIDRRSSRRRRTFANATPSSTPGRAAEVDTESADFHMLATAQPSTIAKRPSVPATVSNIPSFRIKVKTDAKLATKSDRSISGSRVLQGRKTKVSTVSFR